MNQRYPVYKKIRVPVPFCNVCKEMLVRYTTHFNFWECSCGKWEYAQAYGTFEVKQKKPKEVEQQPPSEKG